MTQQHDELVGEIEGLLRRLELANAAVSLASLARRWTAGGRSAQALAEGLGRLIARGELLLDTEDGATTLLRCSPPAVARRLMPGDIAELTAGVAAAIAACGPTLAQAPKAAPAPKAPEPNPWALLDISLPDRELLRARQEALTLQERPWHVLYGCRPVAEGCRHCAAHEHLEAFHRNAGRMPDPAQRHRPYPVAYALAEPARWSTPQCVVVAPWSDLFQPEVPADFIARVLAVIVEQPRHMFFVTTRYPERMRELLAGGTLPENLSLGVAAEDAASYAERLPYLFDVPAAWRHVVLEPLLGAVDLRRIELSTRDLLWPLEGLVQQYLGVDAEGTAHWLPKSDPLRRYPRLDWVIAGGERGARPRPPHPAWVRALRDACRAHGVPFYFRGFGDCVPTRKPDLEDPHLVIVSPDGLRRGRGAGSAINRLAVADDEVYFTRLTRADAPIQFFLDGERLRERPPFDRRLRRRLVDVSPLARELQRLSESGAPAGPTTAEHVAAHRPSAAQTE
jgi:protein gp37